MTPTDLLNRLEAEGVGVSLNLKVTADEKPSDDTRALIRDNRDALLEHLADELFGYSKYTHGYNLQDAQNYQRAGSLHLYGDLLKNLMAWTARYYELRLEHPGGVILSARPEHIRDALELHPWGVAYTGERHVLLTWGNVPTSALLGKRDLLTDEPLVIETRAAA